MKVNKINGKGDDDGDNIGFKTQMMENCDKSSTRIETLSTSNGDRSIVDIALVLSR